MPGVDLQQLLAAFPDAVLSIDRRSVILFANEAAIRLFGFPRETFIGGPSPTRSSRRSSAPSTRAAWSGSRPPAQGR